MDYVLFRVTRGYDSYFESYTSTHITVTVMSKERAKKFTKKEANEQAAILNIGKPKIMQWKVIPFKSN